MKVTIYYRKWDGKNGSHEFLKTAVQLFLKDEERPVLEAMTVTADGKFQKPYIRELPDLHFSISHSGNWWICAVSEGEVGLDIQEEKVRNPERLAKRFFHSDEIRWLEKNGFDQFCRIWAYKESYVKYTGVGLLKGMDYFSTANPDTGVLGVCDVCQKEILFKEGYALVLTSKVNAEVILQPL
jgi:4'-phosphopantetheinyl transferase